TKTSTSARSRSSSAPNPSRKASTGRAPARSARSPARELRGQATGRRELMEVCTLDWHIVPLRADRFLDVWEAAAAKMPAYGARNWSLTRSTDDQLWIRQTSFWESRSDFERYWFSDEIEQARASVIDLYDIPLLPAWHILLAAE